MNRLDQFIDIHRDKMDILEPDEGHFTRFREKLNKGKNASLKWILRIASVIFIAALVSINLLHFRSKSGNNLPYELKETAWFYNSRSEKLLSEIQNIEFINSSEKHLILKDIRSFDQEYEIILENLKKYPGDERLINAFIDYHRSRTQFLEEILVQIHATNLIMI